MDSTLVHAGVWVVPSSMQVHRYHPPPCRRMYVLVKCCAFASFSRAHSPDIYQVDNKQHARSTTLQRCRPYAPAGNAVRVRHTHLRCTAVAGCVYRSVCGPQSNIYLSLLLLCDRPTRTLDGNVRAVWIKLNVSTSTVLIFPTCCVSFPKHTP